MFGREYTHLANSAEVRTIFWYRAFARFEEGLETSHSVVSINTVTCSSRPDRPSHNVKASRSEYQQIFFSLRVSCNGF